MERKVSIERNKAIQAIREESGRYIFLNYFYEISVLVVLFIVYILLQQTNMTEMQMLLVFAGILIAYILLRFITILISNGRPLFFVLNGWVYVKEHNLESFNTIDYFTYRLGSIGIGFKTTNFARFAALYEHEYAQDINTKNLHVIIAKKQVYEDYMKEYGEFWRQFSRETMKQKLEQLNAPLEHHPLNEKHNQIFKDDQATRE